MSKLNMKFLCLRKLGNQGSGRFHEYWRLLWLIVFFLLWLHLAEEQRGPWVFSKLCMYMCVVCRGRRVLCTWMLFMYMCVVCRGRGVLCTWMQCPWEARIWCRIPWSWSHRQFCAIWHGCWELSLQELSLSHSPAPWLSFIGTLILFIVCEWNLSCLSWAVWSFNYP